MRYLLILIFLMSCGDSNTLYFPYDILFGSDSKPPVDTTVVYDTPALQAKADHYLDSSIIYGLNARSYSLKSDGSRDFGYMSEDVAELNPLLCTWEDEKTPAYPKYERFTVLAIEELKKFKPIVEAKAEQSDLDKAKDRIKILEGEVEDLKKAA